MSYIYHGTTQPIKTGDRVTRIFPSGLCCIQENWITRKGANLGFGEGAILRNSSPCIDRAYVFPAPEENEAADGFTRWNVTGYGRVNTQGSTRFNRTIQSLILGSSTILVQIGNPIVSRVLPTTGELDLSYQGDVLIYDESGKKITQLVIDSNLYKLKAETRIDRVDSVAYGFFTEYTISYSANIVIS